MNMEEANREVANSIYQRTPIPGSVYYPKIKPKAYATKTSAYRFQPTGFIANNIGSNDIVRFIISLSSGYWDPYSAYFNLIANVGSNPGIAGDLTNGYVLQIDSSAQSFFSSSIIYKDGKELERIMEYDTIACFLSDINGIQLTRSQREQEGCGGNTPGNIDEFQQNLPGFTWPSNLAAVGSQFNGAGQTLHFLPMYNQQTYQLTNTSIPGSPSFPTISNQTGFYQNIFPAFVSTCTSFLSLGDYNLSPLNPYDADAVLLDWIGGQQTWNNTPTAANPVANNLPWFGGASSPNTFSFLGQGFAAGNSIATGFENTTVTQYNDQNLSTGGANTAIVAEKPITFNYSQITNATATTYPYPINWPGTFTNEASFPIAGAVGGGSATWSFASPNFGYASAASAGFAIIPFPTQLFPGAGFSKAFTTNFGGTCFEPRFCNMALVRSIQFGIMAVSNNLVHSLAFPYMSGFLGGLIPHIHYKLLPMSALRELIVELKMSPYALFASNSQCSRQYSLQKLELVVEIIELDPVTAFAVESQINGEGFYFQSVSWFLGPTYNITNNQVPGQLQVNLGFDSLKTIILLFLSNDYQKNSAARKQYRLSHNLTTLQLQIGAKYYPQQPITGNSGTNLGQNNNSEFYINTLKAFNILHKMNTPNIIGVGNTAINFRNWDPSHDVFLAGNTLANRFSFTSATLAGGLIALTPTQAIQLATNDINYYYENSVVGKALYGFDLEGFNYEDLIGGVNTNIERSPFNINLTFDSTQLWPRQSTAYVFCLYDFIVRISRFSVDTLGRA